MKLPWDKQYLKISFHVVFTVIIIYILILIANGFAFVIADLPGMFSEVSRFAGRILGLFSPLIVALVIAYLLDPLVDFFQKHYGRFHQSKLAPLLKKGWCRRLKLSLMWIRKKRGKKSSPYKRRAAGATLTYLMIFLILGIIVAFFINRMGNSTSFLEYLRRTVVGTMNQYTRMMTLLKDQLSEMGLYDQLAKHLDSFSESIDEFIAKVGQNLIRSATSIGSGILNFFISLVVAFYILLEKERLKTATGGLMDTFLPKRVNHIVRVIAGDCHAVFSGYIRGQVLDAIAVGFAVGISLSLVGSNFALVIGVITGFSALIPYFGGIIAFILSCVLELLMGTPIQALRSAITIIVVQQLDSIFLVPRIVGEKVNLSPPVVMLSLTIAGSVFGVVGMVLVVPCCAIAKIFLSRFINRYRRWKARKNTAPSQQGEA